MVGPGQKTGMIMIIQLIHRRIKRWAIKAGHIVAHGVRKGLAVPQQIRTVFIAVLFHTGQKPGYWLHKGVIVHHRIPFISLQPGIGISIMFRQNQGIRIRFFHRFSEFFPETVIVIGAVPQIRRHVQPPAVHIIRRRYPFAGDI